MSYIFLYCFFTSISVKCWKYKKRELPKFSSSLQKEFKWKLGANIDEYIGNHIYDPNGEKVNYSVSGLPTGVYFDPKTDTIRGKTYQTGLYPLVVFASTKDAAAAYIIKAIAGEKLPNHSNSSKKAPSSDARVQKSYEYPSIDTGSKTTSNSSLPKKEVDPKSSNETSKAIQPPSPKKNTQLYLNTTTKNTKKQYTKNNHSNDQTKKAESTDVQEETLSQKLAVPPAPPPL